MNPALIELLAAMAGLSGALLLALNGRRAGYGFALFTLSNFGWIAFAAMQGHWALLAQNVGFMATSLLGCWVWLVKPMLGSLNK